MHLQTYSATGLEQILPDLRGSKRVKTTKQCGPKVETELSFFSSNTNFLTGSKITCFGMPFAK